MNSAKIPKSTTMKALFATSLISGSQTSSMIYHQCIYLLRIYISLYPRIASKSLSERKCECTQKYIEMGVDLFLAYHKRQIPLFVIVLFNATCELPHPYNKIGDGPEGPEVYLMGEGMRQIADQRNLLNLSVRSGKYVTKSLV